MKNNIFLWLAILLVVVTGWLLVPNTFWLYFFFLRIPLLMGVLLLALPAIAKFILPAMLKNLFVLRSVGQMAFTILGATVAGMAVVFVTAIIIDNAPVRFGVPSLPTISHIWYYVLAIALAFPTTLAVTDLSGEEIGNKRWSGLVLGVGLGGGFLFLFKTIKNFLAIDNTSDPLVAKLVIGLNQFLVQIISWLAKHSTAGYVNPTTGNLTPANFNAFVFFIVLLVVYLVIFVVYRPRLIPHKERKEAPALLYVMLLIAIATLFLGNFTFYFDYSRVSVLFFWLVVASLMYWLLRVDHFFVLREDPQPEQEPTDFKTLIAKRLHKQTLVIVCASGGGIQAAGWTAQVLTGLQADDLLGKSFPKAINLISSVSGGSVGAMYYLDHFTAKGFPPDEELDQIFNSATADSLDAVGWGLAYPDLWRLISLPILAPRLLDRGTALETDWQSHMQQPKESKSLATWRQEIMQGNLPIPVFNATLVEDGFRLLISPMNFGKSFSKKFFDFHSLYPGYDLNVVTAARLSATFPYVSPICRDDRQTQKNYHVADGGYFDNSGFVTAVEWLMELLKTNNQDHKLKNVLILQINPFPESSLAPQAKKNPGLFMATLGSLLTIFKVRDPISQARNCAEVELLQQKWQSINQTCQEQRIDIQYFPIFFPSQEQAPEFYNQQGEYRPPLSWKLTQKEKNALKHGWQAIKNSKQITELKQLWREQWQMTEKILD
ncbi:MAG: patatin-like phospholipase family protein [Waterburya sp.]